MTSVRCILCFNERVEHLVNIEKLTEEGAEAKATLEEGFKIRSSIIGRNNIEDNQLLGAELVKHMQASHMQELQKIAVMSASWNGFNVAKYFETESPESNFEKEKEEMREKFLEEVMFAAPDEEEEIEDDDIFEEEDDEEDEEELEPDQLA